MQNNRQSPPRNRTTEKTGIVLALVVALVLHGFFLLLPIAGKSPPVIDAADRIELQLSTLIQQTPEILQPLLVPDPEPIPEPMAKPPVETPVKMVEVQPVIEPQAPPAQSRDQNLENMSKQEISRMTNTILARQFITEESVTDQIFGKQSQQKHTELIKEFHYPVRPDMLVMLKQPMPELPFAYTPGLINFAYEPGVKGDLQRFWDVITPEFGWTTDNGTEFKCRWILVIAGCGWK